MLEIFINCVYQHEEIFVHKQLLKAKGVHWYLQRPILASITWRLGRKVIYKQGCWCLPWGTDGHVCASSNKWQNTSTSYNVIKDCCRPAQFGPPYATPGPLGAGAPW